GSVVAQSLVAFDPGGIVPVHVSCAVPPAVLGTVTVPAGGVEAVADPIASTTAVASTSPTARESRSRIATPSLFGIRRESFPERRKRKRGRPSAWSGESFPVDDLRRKRAPHRAHPARHARVPGGAEQVALDLRPGLRQRSALAAEEVAMARVVLLDSSRRDAQPAGDPLVDPPVEQAAPDRVRPELVVLPGLGLALLALAGLPLQALDLLVVDRDPEPLRALLQLLPVDEQGERLVGELAVLGRPLGREHLALPLELLPGMLEHALDALLRDLRPPDRGRGLVLAPAAREREGEQPDPEQALHSGVQYPRTPSTSNAKNRSASSSVSRPGCSQV